MVGSPSRTRVSPPPISWMARTRPERSSTRGHARKLLPGDAEIGLLSARLELALGDREAARRAATREMTRPGSAPDLDAARSVLAQIDERASIR